MSKPGKIIFWITYPLTAIVVAFLLLFYLDLANGPLYCFVAEVVIFLGAIVFRILLRNRRFYIRALPNIILLVANLIIIPFAKPTVKAKSAAYYDNPVSTEVLTLLNGKVQGVYNEDKIVEIYAGIPYAKAPIGDLRWKEPQDVENWDGVKDCSFFGARAMQNDQNPVIGSLVDIYAQKSWHPDFNEKHFEPMSEDCLNLTIWKPAGDVSNLPILVYIHGGSLTTGSASYEDYNGEESAKKGIIMINIQYRLGVFGYFAHPSLIEESPNNTTGNYGLLDQIKALEWINKNAECFGGDKLNITIAGESAGSSSVSALCASPRAKNLFRRAIGESSSVVVKTPPHTYRTMEEALKTGEKIMKEMNCSSIEEMRNLPASKLLTTKYSNSSMTLDGYALEKNPYEVYLAHEQNEEALLNGFNILEGDAFVVPQFLLSPTDKSNIHDRLVDEFDEVYANKIEAVYKDKIDKDAFSAFNEIFSVYWFMHPHYSWRNLASDAGDTVYSYQFTKENGFHGTYHAGELIYAYGNVKRSPYSYRYNDSDKLLSETMNSYWINFVKTGNPNGDDLPLWSEYDKTENNLMELGENVGPIKDPYLDLYPIIDEYIDYRIANPKISVDD